MRATFLILSALVVLATAIPAGAAAQSDDEVAPASPETTELEEPDLEGPKAETGPAEPDRPWAEGVSDDDRALALERFRRANERFAQAEYAEAAALYREALEHWDHPAIHGNLSVSLIHLDDPIGALHEVEAALAHGAAPFEPSTLQQLQTNRRLLRDQLARVVVVAETEGAEVLLDGELLFVAPGRGERLVRVGSHRVVATADRHLTFVRAVDALPGEATEVEVRLVPLEDAARYEQRWPAWIPYVTLAGGLALVGTGVGLRLAAAANIDEYDDEVASECPVGCPAQELPAAVRDLEERGKALDRTALVSFVLGGLGTAAGVALVFLNRPRRIEVDATGAPLAVSPSVGPRGAGITLRGAF